MAKDNHLAHLLRIGVPATGGISAVLGLVVLAGWYTQTEVLIQVHPAFVPMQYNTATGFLLGGLGLLALVYSQPHIAVACGGVVAAIGILTLVEYIFGVDLGIDQLMMKHYVTVKTSHPGRMAPNTALCFSLTGIAIIMFGWHARYRWILLITGMLGAVILGLGIVAFSGYLTQLESAYGWGYLTRMAIHTAFGFMILGTGLFILAWDKEQVKEFGIPYWFPPILGLCVIVVTVSLWQALHAQEMKILEKLPGTENLADETMLVFGVVMALAIFAAAQLVQVSRRKEQIAEESKREAENEITERQLAEDKLRQARDELEDRVEERTRELSESVKEAEHANRAKSEFLASMSHDLRTPLNAIMGFAQVMEVKTFGPLGDPHYEEYAKDIHDSGNLLVSLIDDILDISKIESGKYELDEKTLDVSLLVQSSVKMISTLAEARKLHLATDMEPNLPMLRGDKRAITQVLNNLLSNAVKFTPADGKATISAKVDGDGSINVLVADTGEGMSESDITKVLNPFEQADSVHAKRHEGTGLGLYLCQKFIELYDGDIMLRSKVGKGTTVTLRFPPERTVAS
jgi:signal transduction histidine kinase